MKNFLATLWPQLAKSPMYTILFLIVVGALLVVGLVNHEPVGPYIAASAATFFGSSALKNHSDVRYGNGGNGNDTTH